MYKDSVAIIRPIENGPRLKGILAGIEFYMLIKQNYLDVNCPSDFFQLGEQACSGAYYL
jgi:hypothetical protein